MFSQSLPTIPTPIYLPPLLPSPLSPLPPILSPSTTHAMTSTRMMKCIPFYESAVRTVRAIPQKRKREWDFLRSFDSPPPENDKFQQWPVSFTINFPPLPPLSSSPIPEKKKPCFEIPDPPSNFLSNFHFSFFLSLSPPKISESRGGAKGTRAGGVLVFLHTIKETCKKKKEIKQRSPPPLLSPPEPVIF